MRPRTYRIVVSGHLDESFATGLDGASQRYEDSATVLEGEFIDQSHLHGLLERLRSLGLEIVEFSTLNGTDQVAPLGASQDAAAVDPGRLSDASPNQPAAEVGAIALLEVPSPPTATTDTNSLPAISPQRESSTLRRVLLVIGVLSSLFLFVVAALALPHLDEGTGERTYHPTTFEAVEPHYEFGIGSLTVDLRDVDFPPGTHRITVDHGIGSARVFLPADVAYDVTTDLAAGEIDVFGDTENGFDNDVSLRADRSSGPVVIVDLEVDIGYGRVRHD